jgi:DNA-binding CsgD family transcriptional regulator
MAVTTRDVMHVLDTVRAMNDAETETFERSLLAAARTLLDCDTVSYNEHHLERGVELRCAVEPRYVERSPARADYLRHLVQHPPVRACATGQISSGDCVALSDLMTARQFHQLPIYVDYFRSREVEDQLVAVVKARDARSILVVFSRSRRGFTTRERSAVSLLVPHIQQAVRLRHRLASMEATVAMRASAAVSHAGWEALTQRERDIVTVLAAGATDQKIARTLTISPRTVGKHLENIYRKLGIPGRTALVAALVDPHVSS